MPVKRPKEKYMTDFASMTEMVLCACIIMVSMYGWGKMRTYMALRELKQVEKLLHAHKPIEAVKKLEGLKLDLEENVHYWYVLGLSFAQMGSTEHAKNAFIKVLEYENDYLDTHHILHTLTEYTEGLAA